MGVVKVCLTCNRQYPKHRNVCRNQWARSKFCSRKCDAISKIGRRCSPNTEFKLGFKHSDETKKKFALRKGVHTGNWKGGITPKNTMIRMSPEYRAWRTSVFQRDNYTCQMCQKHGVQLHADHIKPFAFFPELRLSLDNGRTLCVDCHKKTPTFLKTKLVIN